MPVLIVTLNDDVQIIELPEGKPVYVGRTDDCEICITSPTVSRRHAVFLFQNGHCGVKDLGSINGTLLNDKQLKQSAVLADGDTIRISKYLIKFKSSLTASGENHSLNSERRDRVEPRLPRAMTTSGFLDALPTAPRSGSGNPGEDTRVIAKDGRTEIRRRSSTVIVPGEAKRIGPRADRVTSVIVKKDVIGAAPPTTRPTPATPSLPPPPGVYIIKEAEPGVNPEEQPARDNASDPDTRFIPKESMAIDLAPDAQEATVGNGYSRPSRRRTGLSKMIVRGEPSSTERHESDTHQIVAFSGVPEVPVKRHRPDSVIMHSRPRGENDPGVAVARDDGPEVRGEIVRNPPRDSNGEDTLPIDRLLKKAIESRLDVYSLLHRLSGLRDSLRKDGALSPGALEELNRQEEEARYLPLPRHLKRLMDTASSESPTDSEGLRKMRRLAMQQWTALNDSLAELPDIYARAYETTAQEPFRLELEKAGIVAVPLLGGANYYLVLEKLLEEAKSELAWQQANRKDVVDFSHERPRNNTVVRMLRNILSMPDDVDDPSDSARAHQKTLDQTLRVDWISRELAFIERVLVQEFHAVYSAVAAHFIPLGAKIPLAVRAFLRFGAISFKPWWMSGGVHNRVVIDCSGKVRERFTDSPGAPESGILYADEYLHFVFSGICSPSPGLSLGAFAANLSQAKGFSLYREVIDGKITVGLLRELIDSMRERRRTMDAHAAEFSLSIKRIEDEDGMLRGELLKLTHELQVLQEEAKRLDENLLYVDATLLPKTKQAVDEAEATLLSEKYPIPDPVHLVRRECDIMATMAAESAAYGERFMPLALRDHLVVKADVVVDRQYLAKAVEKAARTNPGVFSKTVAQGVGMSSHGAIALSPLLVIAPMFVARGRVFCPREDFERGRLYLPICLSKATIRDRVTTDLFDMFVKTCTPASQPGE